MSLNMFTPPPKKKKNNKQQHHNSKELVNWNWLAFNLNPNYGCIHYEWL